jgi:hypothetical protein
VPDLSIGVLAAPGLPAELAPEVATELRERLAAASPTPAGRCRWSATAC